MTHIDARTIFPNYLARKPILPNAFWVTMRIATILVWIGMAGLLVFDQDMGLFLLWQLVVPVVPALLVVAPGLWRQICPMASFNQAPQMFGFSKKLSLPEKWQNRAFLIAILIFFVAVCMRRALLNQNGIVTGSLLLACLVLAFAGGLFFKGRSGWCGTFCPLGPIQRAYGHAPAVNIPQTFCTSCIGCQKNCYDFNPVASQFDELWDEDPRYAAQRRFFVGMLPGFILAYFLQSSATYGYELYLIIMVASALASVGFYLFATSFLRIDPYICATGFAAAALLAFYWFAGPMILGSVGVLLGFTPPNWAVAVSQLLGSVCTLSLVAVAMKQSATWTLAHEAAQEERKLAALGNADTHEISNGSLSFRAIDGQLMLEAMGAAGLPVVANCKAGLCGSDAFAVIEGEANLSAPTDDELSTLKRLGLEGRARLACSCRVFGPVTISSLSALAEAPNKNRPAARALAALPTQKQLDYVLGRASQSGDTNSDPALSVGIRHVVIIGNGVAGVTAADELRKASPGVRITLIGAEEKLCYNRMALNKILEGKSSLKDLILQTEDWYDEREIELMMGARVEAIHRRQKRIALDNGLNLSYDKLILATGARANVPDMDFITKQNCFVMRTTDDAEVVRRIIDKGDAKHAVVFGAGVLGIETAESLSRGGIATTLIGKEKRLMQRQLDQETSTILQKYLSRLAIGLKFGASLAALEDGAVARYAILTDGSSIEADIFIACIGVKPNIELARQAGLSTSRGILVDPEMHTSDLDIFAIGDAAELRGTQHGLWQVAVSQARTAVATMLGQQHDYCEPRTIMRLKSNGVEMRTFGSLAEQPGDEIFSAPPFASEWWRVIVRDQHICGAVFIGPYGRESPLWDLVRADVAISPFRQELTNGDLKAASLALRAMKAAAA